MSSLPQPQPHSHPPIRSSIPPGHPPGHPRGTLFYPCSTSPGGMFRATLGRQTTEKDGSLYTLNLALKLWIRRLARLGPSMPVVSRCWRLRPGAIQAFSSRAGLQDDARWHPPTPSNYYYYYYYFYFYLVATTTTTTITTTTTQRSRFTATKRVWDSGV